MIRIGAGNVQGLTRPSQTRRAARFGALPFDKFDPTTTKLIQQYQALEADEVNAVIAASRKAFTGWSETGLKKRAAVLKETANLIQENADELAKLISRETGKPLKEALESDITTAVSTLNYYAKIGPKLLKDRRLPVDKSALVGRMHYEHRVPRGVVAVISPWNYPFAIPVSGLAAALMGGNTAILKPSELTPGVGQRIVELFQAALDKQNLSTNIVQAAVGDSKTGQALVNGDIDFAVFTGSDKTGEKVRNALQARGKEASLELGGSDPMIVLESAKDLDAVTSYALWGRFTNAGQTCAAVKRLIIPRSREKEIVDLLKQKIETLRVGSFEESGNHVGPLISAQQRQIIDDQVQDAVGKGATLVAGGKPKAGAGWFYEPTLLTNVPADSRVLNEEVFGPVLPVLVYDTPEEAIRLANDCHYGLTASVFGKPDEAAKIARRLQAGVVGINDVGTTQYAFPAVPWQGHKHSGPGVSHGPEGLLATTLPQTLSINHLYKLPFLRKQPWHFAKDHADEQFSKDLVKSFGSGKVRDKARPGLLKGFFRNRSGKKI